MVHYRRNLTLGATFFFTVALADRRSTQLTSSITDLFTAFRTARVEHPFTIDAIVILPDHLHVIFTLPDGHPGSRSAGGRSKRCSPAHLLPAGHQA